MRREAAATVDHVVHDLLAADRADRLLDRHRLVRLSQELDPLAACEQRLIVELHTQLGELLQFVHPSRSQRLLHHQLTVADGDPQPRRARAARQAVDLPAHAVAQQPPAFFDAAPEDQETPVEIVVARQALPLAEAERQRRWRQLSDIYLAQQISNYPPDYLRHLTVDRLLETIERYEEDLTDRVRVHGHLKAIIDVGPPIPVSPELSWGKVDPDSLPDAVVCYADTTIILPLLTHYALSRHQPRQLRRLYQQRAETMQLLHEEARRNLAAKS